MSGAHLLTSIRVSVRTKQILPIQLLGSSGEGWDVSAFVRRVDVPYLKVSDFCYVDGVFVSVE